MKRLSLERRGVAAAVCLGDLVGYGPFPNEVAALLRDRDAPCTMGNHDRGVGFATGDCGCVYVTDEQRAEGAASLAWTTEVTTDETRAYLRSLEDRFVLETPVLIGLVDVALWLGRRYWGVSDAPPPAAVAAGCDEVGRDSLPGPATRPAASDTPTSEAQE